MASFFFRNKQKTDVVKSANDLLQRLWQSPTPSKQVEDELAKLLAQMKTMLQGTQDVESSPEQVLTLVNSMIQEDFLYSLSRSIQLLPFESRKDTQSIFSYVFRFKPPNATNLDPPALVYVTHSRPETVINLCRGYEHKESAMPCGVVLREALKNEAIAAIILYDDSPIKTAIADSQGVGGVFWNFFTWIDGGAFEVSTDAFTTFREILTKHKKLIAQFMTDHFEVFFAHYNNVLVQSSSYVTKRQSIKLLGELLLDRANYNVMTAYVDKGDHLKLCMNLLRDDRKMVQYEGFHVFKVFVANPNKSPAVHSILTKNRDRLLNFLPRFLEDRTDDDQFTDEKSFLIRQIESLPPSSA